MTTLPTAAPRSTRDVAPGWCARLGLALAATLALLGPTALAQTDDAAPPAPAPAPVIDDGPVYQIGAVTLRYLRDNPGHPPLEDALALRITLGVTDTGYVAPRPEVPEVTWTVHGTQDAGPQAFHATGLQHVLESLRDHFVAQDLLGIYVAPNPSQIDERGGDRRPAGDTSLNIVVVTGIVEELRTIGSGDRVREGGDIEPEERINHPLHERILLRAPVQPASPNELDRSDLLRRSELDRYLFHLGRHPGRRVDASLSAAEEIGGLNLDLLVSENRPLILYAQVSNTGTRSTDRWRERFGLLHTQLTDNDDIFSLDYSTAGFDETHTVTAAYEAPFENDRVRWRVFGGYSEYTASDVGAFFTNYDGDLWYFGAELVANVHQDQEAFVDLVGGVRFLHTRVKNPFIPEGEEDFLIPYVGVRLDRTTEWYSTLGQLTAEFQSGSVTDVDQTGLARLGRTLPDEDWVVLRGNFTHSVYLEPLLDREAWQDPSTPESSTLAHELRFSGRGQYAFDNRLVPPEEAILGGVYTVRGYPQSVIAGDSMILGSVEYRFHLPRALGVQSEPGELFGEPFRATPQFVYGTPDWDLVLKGFFDIGRVFYSDPQQFFESEETLMGVGVGLELLYRRNLNVRLDWGFALEAIDAQDVNSGSNRLHVVATILF